MSDQYESLVERILNKIPADIGFLQKDLSQHVQHVVDDWLKEMNLVTYEEFLLQQKVLEKTRAKLEALEADVAALEKPTE